VHDHFLVLDILPENSAPHFVLLYFAGTCFDTLQTCNGVLQVVAVDKKAAQLVAYLPALQGFSEINYKFTTGQCKFAIHRRDFTRLVVSLC
jgi:hypothetical protein